MTGVLAGFAFTAIVFLLAPAQVTKRGAINKAKDNGALATLFAAFIGLIIATLTYSVLAGETSEVARGRAATVELVDGVPFGLAVIMLFQGITQLMQGGKVDRVAIWTARAFTVAVAPALTLYYIGEGVSDTEAARALASHANSCPSTTFPVLGTVLSSALFVVLATALIPKLQPTVLQNWAGRMQGAVPITVLIVSVVAAVAAGYLDAAKPAFLMPRPAVNVFLGGTFVLLALTGLILALGQQEHRMRSNSPKTALKKPQQTALAPASQHGRIGTREADLAKAKDANITGILSSEALRERHGTYLANHYVSLHVTIVSLALGVAGLAAASLLAPPPEFHKYQLVFCLLWLASLLATAVAYAGTMIGAIALPPRIPAVVDLLLPLLLGISEFLLFGILTRQVTGPSSVRAVLTGWWFALGAFGLLAATSVWRAFYIISLAPYDSAIQGTVERYRRYTYQDIFAAGAIGLLGVGVGSLYALYGTMPIWASYLLASIPVLFMLRALGSHRRVANELRLAFTEIFD